MVPSAITASAISGDGELARVPTVGGIGTFGDLSVPLLSFMNVFLPLHIAHLAPLASRARRQPSCTGSFALQGERGRQKASSGTAREREGCAVLVDIVLVISRQSNSCFSVAALSNRS